jgi:alcohol dehydrogenase
MRARSLLLTAPRQLRWVDDDLPPLGPRDLLVETRTGAISMGTELPLFAGIGRATDAPRSYPRMTGYESVGVVIARGTGVRRVRVGDRVVATYGHRTHAVVPAARAVVVPAALGDALAVLTILSGDVATGVRKLGPALRGPVLVTGAGTIGLLAVFVLTALGAPAVDVVEPRPERRALALRLGATSARAPEDAASPVGPYAGGVECSSRDAAFALLQAQIRPSGRICVLADGNLEPLTLAPAFHVRQLTVVGSSDCPSYRDHMRWYAAVAPAVAPELERIFDRHVSAHDLPATFARLAAGTEHAIKVLVHYAPGPPVG